MKTKKPRFAAKILALVLSLLMLLGAMPVSFAAEGDIVVKWPTASREIEFGERYSDVGLNNDGETTVPGKFVFTDTTANAMATGVKERDINFVPDDTSIAPVAGKVTITVNKATPKNIELVGGSLKASALKAGQSLSDSVIDKTNIKIKANNYTTTLKAVWKEPAKVMDTAGENTEIVLCTPSSALYKKYCEPLEVEVVVMVEGGADTIAVTERPTASDIELGQILGDSVLTGGIVTKGGIPVAGTFAWKDPSMVAFYGKNDYTVVFTPDDLSICEPQEMQVSVTAKRPEMKLTWPEVKGQYKVGGYVDDCVTLTGGEANIPGVFRITEESKYMKIPASITESMDIELIFIPEDLVNYTYAYKTVNVSFEPANPDCEVTLDKLSETQMRVNYFIKNDENWNLKTGKLYLVLDGEKIELDRYSKSFVYDATTIAPGTHTVQTIYEQGADDYYVSDMSDVQEFNIKAIYAVNVSDSAGDKVLGSYLPGKTVTVTAAPHEKSYYDFTGWTAEGVELTEEELAQQKISFTMPENEVKLTANYKLNFGNFVKYVFEQIGAKLMALVMQGIEWIKGLLP